MFDALNHEIGLSTTQNNVNGTNGRATPYKANSALCEMDMPSGENYSVGSPYIKLTNESYNFVYNSNGVHFISRVKGNGECEIVNYGCLDLSVDPERYIAPEFRAYMRRELVCPNRDGKYLVWTDGSDFGIGYLDVEASIATNFFTTPFFERCSTDPCDFVRLCVPEICGCISAEFIPLTPADAGLTNNTTDRGLMFMVKHVYYDGRESEWSDRSTLYYQETNACFAAGTGLSRCLRLRIPVGNPMVEKIKVAFSENGGFTWFICETIEKYKKYNDLQQKWYERDLAELENFSETDCSFDYIFCNDKERIQVPESEVTRVRNPIPREAQGFIEIKESIGVFNYKDGVCPVDKFQVEKITIEQNCDPVPGTPTVDCSPVYSTVTVRAIVNARPSGTNRFIYRYGGDTKTSEDDVTDTAYYGGTDTVGTTTLSKNYGQNFEGKIRDFIVYIEGTDYWGIMTQWQSDANFVNRKKVGVIPNMSNVDTYAYFRNFIAAGGFFYQEFKFKVLKGTKGFIRVASQSSQTGTGLAQNTSTSVNSILNDLVNYKGRSASNANFNNLSKEIYFDTCAGDVELKEAFEILDIARPAAPNTTENTAAYTGYIKDIQGRPIEGLVLSPIAATTDYNGYYYFSGPAESYNVNLNGELNCAAFQNIQTMALNGVFGAVSVHNETVLNSVYNANYFLQVDQKLIDCDNNPVAGIKIAISGAKARITDANGIAHFRIRNFTGRNRSITTVVMNGNGCFSLDCIDACNPCMPSNTTLTPVCYFGTPYQFVSDLKVNIKSVLAKSNGLKSGGRYAWAAVLQGSCGLLSAPYPITYTNIPRTQEKGKLSFCGFNLALNGAVFPSYFNCLKIVRSENQNPFELQWVVDKKEYVGDGKVKLTIQSLNDYNQKYFNQTNTVYQWLKGDRIEFVRNGDGRVLLSGSGGILNYLTISPFHDALISGVKNADVNYFNQLIIEDDNRLGDITEGAIIELQRPRNYTGETIYREICVTIPLVNGVPVIENSFFKTFDTYIINRNSGTFLGYFESKYPSDFWGKTTDGVGLDDTGKSHVVNQYETVKRYGQNISINSPVVFNYFGDLIKTICPKSHGDITAMNIWDGRVILGIAEHDNFLAQSADDLLRVGSDGTVRALPADSILSSAEPKVRGQFGCQYDSIGSVVFGDGWSKWIDVNKDADVKHDFNEAVEVSLGRTQTFFRKKCQELRNFNAVQVSSIDKLRFIAGQNYLNGAVMTTIKSLRQPAVNNSFDPYEHQNVTICYHPASDTYLTRAAFTPEAYSMINLSDAEGCAFISIYNGVPYVHPKISSKVLEFYGITCDWMVGVTMNQFPEKDKTALSFELQSIFAKWFVSKVTTENLNFISEIPVRRIKTDKDKCNGAFLNNKNSRGGLYGGSADVPRGYYVNVQFVRDNTVNEEYGTFDNVKRQSDSELGLIFFKYKKNEQSGFENNL